MYENILVPLDGSELAEVALPYAEEFAGTLGSEVSLLAISESAATEHYHEHLTYILKMAEATRHTAERHLEKPQKAIKVESRILVGDPAEEIVDYADKADVSLIVMATHGRSGIRRWALGSVADKVVRATKRPVLLVRARGARPDVREKGMLNRALLCLDGSEQGEAAIPYAGELASKLKAEVVLLHVVARPYHIYEGVRVPYSDEEVKPLEANAERYLKEVSEGLRRKGISVKFEVRVGDGAEEIIRFADEIYADLVAMSTHGQTGISRWVFGSVTDRVLHAGNTPLLLVRTPGAEVESLSGS
jgi:nucleotide-binding universal stress UspA family protein